MTKNRIQLKNGVLDIETLEFFKGLIVEESLTTIPVTYDPSCECKNFESFLTDVIPDKIDRGTIMEFFGYCLLKEHICDVIVLCVGKGRNGKSILLEALKKFVGVDNVATLLPRQIENSRWAFAQLFDKLVNISADIIVGQFRRPEIIKELTSGNTIRADRRNNSPIDFVNYAKFIFSTNMLPMTEDDTTGVYRHFRIIDFPNQFFPEDEKHIQRDILISNLTTEKELSGILNLALQGLKRLKKNGSLSGSNNTGYSKYKNEVNLNE